MTYTIYTSVCVSLLLVAVAQYEAKFLNYRPIIGVLAQETDPDKSEPGDTYIPAPYIKYLESAGARVAPIRVKEPYDYYTNIFKSLNGVLFPGGGVDLTTSEFAKAGRILYDMVLKANDDRDYFPMWGTCLGFELLATITSQGSPLSHVSASDIALPLDFTKEKPMPLLWGQGHRLGEVGQLNNLMPDFSESRLFGNLPNEVYTYLRTENVTENFHSWGLTPEMFELNVHLKDFYHVLSTNLDTNGKRFISTMEGYKYPVYGTQWHPEKPSFIWNIADNINHGPHAIRVLQYMADFFVAEARKSDHHFGSEDEEIAALIDNYSPVFSADSRFTHNYYFNYTRSRQPWLLQETQL